MGQERQCSKCVLLPELPVTVVEWVFPFWLPVENGGNWCTLERHDAVRTPEVHQPKEQTRHAAAKGLGKGRFFFSLLPSNWIVHVCYSDDDVCECVCIFQSTSFFCPILLPHPIAFYMIEAYDEKNKNFASDCWRGIFTLALLSGVSTLSSGLNLELCAVGIVTSHEWEMSANSGP